MSDYWSQYWQQGHLTSFGDDIKSNYQGALQKQWQDFFHGCRNGDSLLDIGTGNGAIIDLALQSKAQLKLVGLDSAKLTIPEHLQRCSDVSFYESVNVEKMPFSNESFDNVVSQFGIEYADLDNGFSELARVLKPTGRYQLVMHDSQSNIVKPNAAILVAAQALSAPQGVLFLLRKLINAIAKIGQGSPQSEQCRNELNSAIGVIAKSNESGLIGTNFPAFLKYVMSKNLSFSEQKRNIKLFERELKGQVIRLDDLANAALDEKRHAYCLTLLKAHKLSVDVDTYIKENNFVVARVISGTK